MAVKVNLTAAFQTSKPLLHKAFNIVKNYVSKGKLQGGRTEDASLLLHGRESRKADRCRFFDVSD